MQYPKISKLNSVDRLRSHLESLGVKLPFDSHVDPNGPLAQPISSSDKPSLTIGNRFCILPMEGWDGTRDGEPTDLTIRRWKNFGISGAKLIWGGEAVAVREDGRANPNQLLINQRTWGRIAELRESLVNAHRDRFGAADDLCVGLQLTHSGRFARPNEKNRLEPKIAYQHPILDANESASAAEILSDDDLKRLIDDFVAAAGLAARAGFSWVDVKHCHGYLGHELLSGFDRPGAYGGSFENRTRFLREIAAGIRAETPELEIGVRLSAFDFSPFQAGGDGVGVPMPIVHGGTTFDGTARSTAPIESATTKPDGESRDPSPRYRFAFGGDGTGQGIDLTEPDRFLQLLDQLGIRLVCTTAGSPYYNPHIQRPAIFPPSDGYLPPEDPLVGVARQINVTARLKANHPNLVVVGSGYSYLQEWLPNVGQSAVERGAVDVVGIGRMVLSYPDLPADVLNGKTLARKKICRTFSDCTTAPRHGLVSGCFPLDAFYKSRPEFEVLKELKRSQRFDVE